MQFHPNRRDPVVVLANAAAWLRAKLVTKATMLRPQSALAPGLASMALLVRLYGLGDKPFWFDELRTWLRARLPFGQLAVDSLTHKHFPTYFILAGPFAATHSPEWMLRLPSVLFGAACVVLVTRLALDARGPIAGLVAGSLMALSPIEVQFAQEARAYALISLLVLTAVWGLVRIAQHPEKAALHIMQPGALRSAWLAYVVGTIGALLVQNNTIPWLLASNSAFMLVVRRAASVRGALTRNWAWSQALILLCWLPALVCMILMNQKSMLDAVEWIPKANWDSVRSAIAALYLFRISDLGLKLMPAPLPGFGAVIALFALLGAWRLRAKPELLAVIGLAFLAMPLTVLSLSAFQPLWVPRYLLWSTGPFFVLAGAGVAALPERFSALIALFIAIGGAINLAPYYGAETKPRWDQAAAYLAAHARPHDVVVAESTFQEFILASYFQISHIDANFPILTWDPRGGTARRAAQAERAWIVDGALVPAQKSEEQSRRKWSEFGMPAEQIRFGSSILILRFDNSPPTQE